MDEQNKTTEQAAQNQDQAQRDEKGRFGKGNRGGPGNPFARQTAKLRQAALGAVSDDDIRAIIEAMKVKAKASDVAASKLLLSYTVGKPLEAADPDTLDQHEMQTFAKNHASATTMSELLQVIEGMPIDALVVMLRILVPLLRPAKMQLAKDVLSKPVDDDEDDEDEDEAVEEGALPAAPPVAAGATAAEPTAGNDNIPAWMYELASRDQELHGDPARADAAQQQKSLSEIQKQIQMLIVAVQGQHAGGHPQEAGDPHTVEGELLNQLRERMKGVPMPTRHEAPPSANGHNGTARR